MLRALLFSLAAVLSSAAAEPPAGARELIPGADKMTAEERDAYRASKLVGDPARGAKLHQGCFGCHGVERYTQPVTHASATFMDSLLRASGLSDLPPAEPKRFKGKITSVDALRAAVVRRNDYFNPQLSAQEIEDVVAYLNKTYYNFPDK
jgi:mono/diheme cytochrome c family protein